MLRCLVVVVALAGVLIYRMSKHMYEGDEVAVLNADGDRSTRWFNMGFWSEPQDTFALAAERLFTMVADALGPLERVAVLAPATVKVPEYLLAEASIGWFR
ncbi:hypothetical protein OIV83_001550 [Microbotryomycetes sp. JL201]|nr:hypothetical protein OIV83_001550 [Microbotryomycetes sp. JL201]